MAWTLTMAMATGPKPQRLANQAPVPGFYAQYLINTYEERVYRHGYSLKYPAGRGRRTGLTCQSVLWLRDWLDSEVYYR